MKFIDELNLKDKRVFIRADLNVPLTDDLEIADDMRIKAALRSVNYAIESGAKVILASHLGRPKGQVNPALSLKPVAEKIRALAKRDTLLAPDCIGEKVKELVGNLRSGDILVLENLRFHPEEEQCNEAFSRELAKLAEVYIDDAFATAHRRHASIIGMPEFMNEKAAGFTLRDELDSLKKGLESPKRPLVAVLGGSKVSTKLAAIKNIRKKADYILIGGAMANTFLAAKGCFVGKSLYEKDLLPEAKLLLEDRDGAELILPSDLIVAPELREGIVSQVAEVDAIGPQLMALDIGPKSAETFSNYIMSAGTVVWNGPVGAFETLGFESGTYAIADAMANTTAYTLIGGGDTDLALHRRNVCDKVDYISTGGGAFLKVLEGEPLPAIQIL